MERLDRDTVRLQVEATAESLYDLVSDVSRTPQWSPKVVSCSWLDGHTEAAVGARFLARNKERWLTWSNKPVVETTERGREFAFTRTEPGGGTIRWFYRFAPSGSGTIVEHGYEVLRPVPLALHVSLRVLLGIRDLRSDLHQNMTTSLGRLADIATTRPAQQAPTEPA
ncbi:SRPBCC family protein [Actinopolymorpha rutila]|uniref:Polyketide cyclase / dehydrase and lipid transport n=1 Tax=Actinopolymorpha rutila TaxID=446787 RepID=A0A852ZFA4_9ACTN|nr:SRPBCC family protein [Actinopolymorpha rutila]NYH87650.1 hypothetical protein [Actinopolymorpha rutila]